MNLMGALIADVAVAVVPLPVPVVVEAIPRERLRRRRAGPEIVRDPGGTGSSFACPIVSRHLKQSPRAM